MLIEGGTTCAAVTHRDNDRYHTRFLSDQLKSVRKKMHTRGFAFCSSCDPHQRKWPLNVV